MSGRPLALFVNHCRLMVGDLAVARSGGLFKVHFVCAMLAALVACQTPGSNQATQTNKPAAPAALSDTSPWQYEPGPFTGFSDHPYGLHAGGSVS
jgi:hypothetical protein